MDFDVRLKKMRIALIPIIIGSLLLTIHAMYPPRILPLSESATPYRIDRAYIFGDHYYRQYLTEEGVVLPSSKREQAKSIQNLQLDWDLFIMQMIVLVGVTVLIASLIVIAFSRQNNQIEQVSAHQSTTAP